MVTIPPPIDLGRDSRRRAAARQALADVLWDDQGRRRLPRERDLVGAIEACDRRDVWWVCEASSAGPVYFLPTREWLKAFARFVDETKARKVLEVAAGDGFLSACLKRARPGLEVIATDDKSWSRAAARMNAADRRAYRGVDFAGIREAAPGVVVEKMGAVAAVKKHRPDLVVVSWAPPGTLVERVIRAPSRLVLDISVDGDVCGNGQRTWRFEKDFLEGPLEERALCRLDQRPTEGRQSRFTLYYGRRHPQHGTTRRT